MEQSAHSSGHVGVIEEMTVPAKSVQHHRGQRGNISPIDATKSLIVICADSVAILHFKMFH